MQAKCQQASQLLAALKVSKQSFDWFWSVKWSHFYRNSHFKFLTVGIGLFLTQSHKNWWVDSLWYKVHFWRCPQTVFPTGKHFTVYNYWALSGTTWNCLELSMELSGTVRNCLELSGTVWNCLKLSTVWNCQQSETVNSLKLSTIWNCQQSDTVCHCPKLSETVWKCLKLSEM